MQVKNSEAIEKSSRSQALRITVLKVEENPPDRGDYLQLHADVTSNGYSGASSFWVSKRSLSGFLDQLEEFDQKLSGRAELACGWGDDVEFGMTVLAYDKLGHIGIKIELASEISGRATSRRRLQVEFDIDSTILKSFGEGIGRLRTDPKTVVVLRGISS